MGLTPPVPIPAPATLPPSARLLISSLHTFVENTLLLVRSSCSLRLSDGFFLFSADAVNNAIINSSSGNGSGLEARGSKRPAQQLSLSSFTKGTAAAAAATVAAAAVQASSLSLVLLLVLSSTTEDDIMSAMRGLDASLSSSSDAAAAAGASSGQPTLTLPAAKKGGQGIPSGDNSSGAIGTGTAQGGGGGVGGGGVGSGGETDLMRTMGGGGGARQAGPLTHGF